MIGSPYAPLDYEYNREELPDKDSNLGHIFNMVIKDIDANRPEHGNLKPDLLYSTLGNSMIKRLFSVSNNGCIAL